MLSFSVTISCDCCSNQFMLSITAFSGRHTIRFCRHLRRSFLSHFRHRHTVSAHRPTHTHRVSRIQIVYKIIIPTALTQIAISVGFGVCRYYIARRNPSVHSIMCQQHLLVRHRLLASHFEQGTSKFGQIVIECSAQRHATRAQGDTMSCAKV